MKITRISTFKSYYNVDSWLKANRGVDLKWIRVHMAMIIPVPMSSGVNCTISTFIISDGMIL